MYPLAPLGRVKQRTAVRLNGVDCSVRKGSLVHIPPGVLHGANGRMRVLVIGIPDISHQR